MDKKVILVTGASGGIGAATARLLGSKGNDIILAARREAELKQVASRSGKNALPIVADVTSFDDVERLKNTAIREFGHIDVWINNAGRGINRRVLDLTESDIDEMFNVNFRSVFYSIQCIMPHFLEWKAGHLINISSFLGRVPLASNRSAYNAAKAALNFLTANLRMDLKKICPGIHVSLVMPGPVTTDFGRNALGAVPQSSPGTSSVRSQTAEEVAEVIASVIQHPVAEIFTNPAQVEIAHRYYADIGAFEENL